MKKRRIFQLGVFMLPFMIWGCHPKERTQQSAPVKVKVCKAEISDAGIVHRFSGTIEAESSSAVSFSVSGTIDRIAVSVGERVHRGQVLATINTATLQNTYNVALAALEQTRDIHARMKQLYDRGSLPEIQWVEVQSKLQQVESLERIARKNLDDCTLRAPFAGIVSSTEMDEGQNTAPGVAVVKLVTAGRVKAKISIPESEIADIAVGKEAQVEIGALKNGLFIGRISERGITANPLTHTYDAMILLDNPQGKILPGMVAKVTVSDDERQETFVLPVSAVQLDERNDTFVWLNVDGKAHRRRVVCGDPVAAGITVVSGLNPGDEVIMEGQQKVSERTPVEPISTSHAFE